MKALTTGQQAVTMTSRELVDYINSSRDNVTRPISHADFLKKVHLVLGAVAGNFSSYYIASNGKRNPCYAFPKREACLMAMSYSYELQAKVFDRMTELEAAHTNLSADQRIAELERKVLALTSRQGKAIAPPVQEPMRLEEAAKSMKTRAYKLRSAMINHGLVSYSFKGRLHPTTMSMTSGYLIHTQREGQNQFVITAHGLRHLRNLI